MSTFCQSGGGDGFSVVLISIPMINDVGHLFMFVGHLNFPFLVKWLLKNIFFCWISCLFIIYLWEYIICILDTNPYLLHMLQVSVVSYLFTLVSGILG